MPPVSDALGRPLANLRLSVTDRCNLRCAYCMPEEEYAWLPRADILRFEEIARLVDAFVAVGVERIRLTGGEPLLRRDLDALVAQLAEKRGIREVALTTNGLLLAGSARALKVAGLTRVSVSLDTLLPERFRALTRRDGLDSVLAGIDALAAAGFTHTKLDTVVMRGVNDDEIVSLLRFAVERAAEIRFIEYMDVGGATRWNPRDVVSRGEMLSVLERAFGNITPLANDTSAPAERFMLADGTVFGIIASTTAPFCRACDRSRLTADGQWYRCLYAKSGTDLRTPLRAGASIDELADLLETHWRARADRGAEERLASHERSPLADAETLRNDPHLEMHTRGG